MHPSQPAQPPLFIQLQSWNPTLTFCHRVVRPLKALQTALLGLLTVAKAVKAAVFLPVYHPHDGSHHKYTAKEAANGNACCTTTVNHPVLDARGLA